MIRLRPFLLRTEFCDSDNSQIMDMACGIVHEVKDPIGQAKLIKEWVQDQIIYRSDFRRVKASETLKKRFGQCTNRSNLQIAFLRALGVPAGYAIASIPKKLFKLTSPPKFYEKISEPTTHVYCAVYDEKFERWRHFDVIPHKVLYRALQKLEKVELRNYNSQGESRYKSEYLVSEIHVHSNIDHLLKLSPRWLNGEYIRLANEHLERLEEKTSI